MLLRFITLCSVVVAFTLSFALPVSAESLLSMRQTILTEQRDRILVGFRARIGPIGRVHGINGGQDCDVHVPLRTPALFLAVLGEIKNACSMGPTRAQLIALGEGPFRVEGAFRIWFEGHDEDVPFREERRRVPTSYQNSGPPHLVELHPVTRLGPLDLRDRVRFVEKDGKTIAWKTGTRFRTAVQTQITIRRQTIQNRRYVVVRCTCPRLANHYQLTVEILDPPHPTDNGDGVIATGRVLADDGGVLLDRARLFAVEGTPAAGVLRVLTTGDRVTVYGLARLSLRPLLERVTSAEQTIQLPIELVLLHAVR